MSKRYIAAGLIVAALGATSCGGKTVNKDSAASKALTEYCVGVEKMLGTPKEDCLDEIAHPSAQEQAEGERAAKEIEEANRKLQESYQKLHEEIQEQISE